MADLHQQSRCIHASRGCARVLTRITLLSHLQECGFAPVQCSHEGCQATVNRQDLVSHQQSCGFRSVTCDDCRETMRQREYGNHSCVLRRRELTEVTRMLREMQAGQLGQQTSETTQATAAMGQRSHNLREQGRELIQFEATQIQQVVTRRLGSESLGQPNATQRQQGNLRELTGPSMSFDVFGAARSISSGTQGQATGNRQIVVAGGGGKSYEIFDWSTQQWTLFKDALFFDHTGGFSFVYDNKVMICGGTQMNRVECLNIPNIRSVCTFPVQLPGGDCGKGVLCADKILTFGKSVSASSLKPPFKTTVLASYNEGWEMPCGFGIARVNENAVILVGGYHKLPYNRRELKDDVLQYNTTTKRIEELAPLPYKLSDMAVVVHNDNMIILGGYKEYQNCICSDVLMYNVTNQQCSKLPSMLEKRSNCAAVIMGGTIIAMGGRSTDERGRDVRVKTAEYLVLGEDTWKELPPMHCEREGATACVMP